MHHFEDNIIGVMREMLSEFGIVIVCICCLSFSCRLSVSTRVGRSIAWHICSHIKTLLMVLLDWLMLVIVKEMLLGESALMVINLPEWSSFIIEKEVIGLW